MKLRRSGAGRVEAFFHAGEKAGRLRMVLVRRDPLEFFEQLALALGAALRGLNREWNVKIADSRLAQDRHALAAQAELLAVLGSFRNLHACLGPVECRHLKRSAKCGRRHRDRYLAEKVGTIALEQIMR